MSRIWWGQEQESRDVYTAALDRIRIIYRDFDYVAVSFSGGKDSTAVLNTTLEVARELGRLPVPVLFFDEEVIADETVEYCERVAANPDVDFQWICLPIKHTNGATTEEGFWYPWAPEDRDKWCRELPDGAVTELPGVDLADKRNRASLAEFVPYLLSPDLGRVAFLLGIRAQESMTRRRAVSMPGRQYPWLVPNAYSAWISKCYPIYDWTTRDVWTAPAQLGWDYNRYYDILEMAGIAHNNQRCAPPFGDEPLRLLHTWAETNPVLWDRMISRVPGAATAARYANSELYGAYDRFVITVGEHPQTTIRDIVLSHQDTAMRNRSADQVRMLINRHYGKTDEPILVNSKHYESGVSWRLIKQFALTGDLKGRKLMTVAPGEGDARPPNVRRYYAEWRELWEAGHRWLPEPPSPEQERS